MTDQDTDTEKALLGLAFIALLIFIGAVLGYAVAQAGCF